MKSLGLELTGVAFNYDGNSYLAHSDCVDKIVQSLPLGQVVIIGPVPFTVGDKCAYGNCEVA